MSNPAGHLTHRGAVCLLQETLEVPGISPEVASRVTQVINFLQRDVLRVGDAAALLGVTENTVKNWIALGTFPGAFRTEGGHWRIPAEEVLALRDASHQVRARNRSGSVIAMDQVAGDPFADAPRC